MDVLFYVLYTIHTSALYTIAEANYYWCCKHSVVFFYEVPALFFIYWKHKHICAKNKREKKSVLTAILGMTLSETNNYSKQK